VVSSVAILAFTALSGCSNMSQRDKNTAVGAGAGAVGGAILTGGSGLGTAVARPWVASSATRSASSRITGSPAPARARGQTPRREIVVAFFIVGSGRPSGSPAAGLVVVIDAFGTRHVILAGHAGILAALAALLAALLLAGLQGFA
jgi:hypothetical protein